MKKCFQMIGIITLLIGSFIYTEKVGTAAKLTDPLLNEIKSKKDGYKENSIEPIIKDNTIIPGINGKEVDTLKSYEAMSKIGYFDDKLLIYKTLTPENSLDKNKDKYIIASSNTKLNVSLIFKVAKNNNLTKVIQVLNQNKIKSSFFIDSTYLEKNHNQIINLIQKGNTVGNLSNNQDYNDSDFIWMKTIITNIGPQKYNYCYTEKPNKKILKICKIQDSYTIMTKTIKNNQLLNIKKKLKPGSIIVLEVNYELNNEIEAIINYIISKGYEIKPLEQSLNS